jgi:hypothetical protein
MTGVRSAPNEAFRYMRIPADENGAIDGYTRFKAALLNRETQPAVAHRFVDSALTGEAMGESLRGKLYESTLKVLAHLCRQRFRRCGDLHRGSRARSRTREGRRNLFEDS